MELSKKRVSSLQLSTKTRRTSLSRKITSVPPSKCIFCQQQSAPKEACGYFPYMINKALYTKYSSSQNYYYTRGLSEFLSNARTLNVIKFKDLLHFDDDEEYLKRFYKFSEYDGKIRMLTEYYKFHKDIARLFMLPLTHIVNRYHDKKRRLEYFRVTKMLKEQNQGGSTKTGPQETQKTENTKYIPLTDRVLDDLDLTQPEHYGFEKGLVTEGAEKAKSGSQRPSRGLNTETATSQSTNKKSNLFTEPQGNKVKGQKKGRAQEDDEQLRDLSISHTIQELNLKLGEIISTSHSRSNQQEFLSYFENSELYPNENISNLNNFLDFIKVTQQSSKISKIPAIVSVKPNLQETKSMPGTCRSPEVELKFTTSKGNTKTNDPFGDQAKILVQKQLNRELNLADDLLKKVSTEQNAKNSRRISQPTQITQPEELLRNRDLERPTTALVSNRVAAYPASASVTSKAKNIAGNNIKIQNFDEALKFRYQASPSKIDSQRSTSREGYQARLSSRTYETKSGKQGQESKPRDIITARRSSQANSATNFSEPSLKVNNKSSKSIFTAKDLNNPVDKNIESLVFTSQNVNARPNSHRDMRISLDMQALGRHMNQPLGFSNPSTATYNGKASSKGGQMKIQSGGVMNFHEKSKSFKITTSGANSATHTTKETRCVPSFGQLEIKEKDFRVGSESATRLSNSKPQFTSHRDSKSSSNMGAVPEQEILNMKYNNIDQLQRKALTHRETNTFTHHKYTKSEGKFGKIDTVLMKKGSLPQSAIFRDAEQAVSEERRKIKDSSPSKKVYTYNHNNIVNIFLNPQTEKLSSEPNTEAKLEMKRAEMKKFEKDSKQSSAEVLIKNNNANQAMRKDLFEGMYKHKSGRESPSTALRREEPRLTKSKSKFEDYKGFIDGTR